MQEFLAKLNRFIKDRFVGEPAPVLPPSPDSRNDLEYENLLWALLEEVEQGKSWGQLQGFLIAKRLDARRLAQWLHSYSARLLAQPESNQELARRLVKLGQVATGELGTVARTLGERLLVPPPSEVNLDNSLATGSGNSGAIAQSGDSDGREVDLDNFQPNNYEAWFNRGNALSDLGQLEEAISSFDQALKIKRNLHEAWYNRGNALFKLGRIEEAIFSYDQALKFQPDFHEAWYAQGVALSDLGRIEEAISSYDQALKIKLDYYEAWYNRGIELRTLGRIEEAISSFDQALKFQPGLHEAWYAQGVALLDLGRIERVISSYDQALKIKPDYYEVWYNRGNALRTLGRIEEAISSYDQALKIKPDGHKAWVNRGIALLDLGRIEEAISSYDQALKIKPDFHYAWNNRGYALRTLGRIEEAISSCDQALKIKRDLNEAWFNRGYAAAKSLGYEPFWQQQFAACFRSEVSEAPQKLIPALEAIDRECCLAQFQASLSASKALLLETFAHLNAPDLIAVIQQPPPSKLIQLIRQSSPQKLIEFIQQPLKEAVVARLEQDSLTHPSRRNPQLNQRGYEGQLASYQAELDKAICSNTHPEGWGDLHHQIGRAHYLRGRKDIHPFPFWRKAEISYKTALQTLKPPEFEELHLDVLQDLIRVSLDLGETEAARELQRQGTDLLRRMLTDPKRTERQKRDIALKSAAFNQLSVDLTLQSGDISGALTLAETGKNTCLRWLLGTGEVPMFDYAQFQRLLTPTTAAIYWHLSPSALTTFVILPNAPAPIVVENRVNRESPSGNLESYDQRPVSLQQVLVWEKWLTEWNQRYQTYGSSKSKKDTILIEQGDKEEHPWRTRMEESLQRLKQILNISHIEQQLQDHPIDTLILIPHRDLHRFPLHAFFDNYTFTYLPSAYLGLQQPTKPQSKAFNSLLIVENPKSTPDVTSKAKTLPDLPFAEVEAALICQMFSEVTAIENPNGTYDQLQKVLPTPHHVFHFTGHAAYNSTNPAQSCLFLHGSDQLTLPDIVRLDLSAYCLVCLAACETAVTGDQTITDEYVGLVSAFLKAGATYVVSTLWTVESAATALFIVEFYQQLHTGQSPKTALKATQTWLKTATRNQLIEWLNAVMPKLSQQRSQKLVLEDLRELLNTMDDTSPPYHHPYYWAAFTISGL